MKKVFFIISCLFFLACTLFFNPSTTFSDELDEINKQINDLTNALNQSVKATQPLEEQVNSIKNRITTIEQDVLNKEKNIEDGYKELAKEQQILNATIRDYYIKSYYNSPLLVLLSANSAAEVTKILGYQKATANRDKAIIINIAVTINDLQQKKKDLEIEKASIASAKAKLDKVIGEAKAYQGELSGQIAELVKQQQSILSQRLSSLNLPTSLGAGSLACVDDREDKYNPGFSPAFAFFTAGIPHRVGLNQYGAYGRSQAGQNHEDILRAYFNNINFETRDNITISVQGYGQMPLEDYLLGIYEMPESWPIEALKSQVIAARSYALSYTNNGANEICTTQSCQVYKQPPKSGAWKQAVEETRGKVMTNGGQVITAWYASTAGGYTFPNEAVWGGSHRDWTKSLKDTPSNINSFSDLENNSYDKDSPCNYAAQGSRDQYNKSAWLRQEEVADIANALLLAKACPECGDHLYQTDKPHPYGGEIWDEARVRQELTNKGITPFTSVSGVSVGADFGSGRTTTVTVSGNKSESFSGEDFKKAFNLRAPANIQIVGPLYNVERR